MAKKVVGFIKLQIPGGNATPAPPVGPALGANGVNIMQFCQQFNAQTQDKAGVITPVEITVYEDKTFSFVLKTPPAAFLIKQALGLESGSGEPHINKVGELTQDQLREIAEIKMPDLNANDIEAAKKDLENVIAELTESMKTEFTEHFRTINENFKRVFTDLFGGGTAEIILDDETDVLGCNIDIKAQPPGKKLQTLSLLSGGERCLTAIGLLFAILELRPSPFVILDEVEAALDDVNISRFTDFVRRHSEKSQFILVTHRKGTMEACDQMYGVTMAERGVSKILSMELK